MKALKFLIIAFLFTGLLSACTGTQSAVSTRSYLLTTGFEDGNLVFLGVGGDINGVFNPTLQANPGETITVTLINGGEGTHDVYFPKLKTRSKRVSEKGESVSITFRVPDQESDLEYYDSVANHAKIGMAGSLQVSGSVTPMSSNGSTNLSGENTGQPAVQGQTANDGEAIFKTKCAACHTIGGGKLVGPDLKGVTKLRDTAWLTTWIKEPDKVLAAGDPIATELLAEFNSIPMPNLGLSDAEIKDLLAYFQSVDGTSAPAPTQNAASPTDAVPAQPANQPLSGAALALTINGDPEYGEKLFTGAIPLINGGTPCIACHSVEGVGIVGGGVLGPDQTHVYTRYGHEGLAAALGSLPFPTMQGIFANRLLTTSEQDDLLAFFALADQQGEPGIKSNLQNTLGIGSGVAVILLIGMLFFWPRQRLSLSQRLRKNGKL